MAGVFSTLTIEVIESSSKALMTSSQPQNTQPPRPSVGWPLLQCFPRGLCWRPRTAEGDKCSHNHHNQFQCLGLSGTTFARHFNVSSLSLFLTFCSVHISPFRFSGPEKPLHLERSRLPKPTKNVLVQRRLRAHGGQP